MTTINGPYIDALLKCPNSKTTHGTSAWLAGDKELGMSTGNVKPIRNTESGLWLVC